MPSLKRLLAFASTSRAFNPIMMGQNSIASGLVAAYSFSEGSGTSVVDKSGNKNTLTLTSVTWTTSGKNGNAAVFNGSTSTSRVTGTDTGLTVPNGFTQMAWIYPTADPGTGEAIIISYYTSAFPYGMVAFDYGNVATGVPTCYLYNGSTYPLVTAPGKLALNAWTHLACTYDKARLKLYVNGTLAGDVAATGTISASGASLYIGDDPGAGDNPPTGRLDDIRIYNRALTQTEIQTLMNTPVAP